MTKEILQHFFFLQIGPLIPVFPFFSLRCTAVEVNNVYWKLNDKEI